MNFSEARKNMVERQIIAAGINDEKIIRLMGKIPRERFLPREFGCAAYSDATLYMEEGRYLMKPLIIAHMLNFAKISSDDVVLHIGCNTGYVTTVLSKLASTVVALENDTNLYVKALENIEDYGVDNAVVVSSDLRTGLPEQAPYNVIFIEGAVSEVPDAICGQLADKGRVVAITGKEGSAEVTVVSRNAGEFEKNSFFNINAPVLSDFSDFGRFVF